jgi:hypothetical protein
MLVCVFFASFARETAGAARIRHFLLPLLSRDDDTQTSGVSRRENVDVSSQSLAALGAWHVAAANFGSVARQIDQADEPL